MTPETIRAIEIAPATAADILTALGPDAKGLLIQQQNLPDLFTLTSSRIDEDATRFIIVEPYVGGRWKDGKAIIEYARDLSYTLVSIYDKKGRRQRIYSVRTQYAEHLARIQQQDQVVMRPQASAATSAPKETYERRQPEPQETTETRQPAPQETTETRQPAVVPVSTPKKTPSREYEWDESKGEYVPSGTVKRPARSEAAEQTESVQKERSAGAESSARRSGRLRRYRLSTTTEETSGAAVSGPAAGLSGTSGGSSPPQEIWLPTGSPSKGKSAKGTVVAAAGAKWVERKDVSVPEAQAPARRTETRSDSSRSKVQKEKAVETQREKPIQEPPVVAQQEQVSEELPAKKKSDETRIQEAPVVARREESPAPRGAVSSPEQGSPQKPSDRVHEESVPSTEELLVSPPDDTHRPTDEGDAWVPKKVAMPTSVDSGISDVAPEPKKVAMLPKQAPVDNSVEKLLKMSPGGKEAVTREGDSWMPKKTSLETPATEVQLTQEIRRLREEEKKRAAPAVKTPIKRDINNPEEGVLPVSSFEKMSGPMYGRHREYERRFYPGKKAKSKAPEHDFYVDEVDRKKEIHNIYFYQQRKNKPPKLVAVQRHEKVSFRGNYDIDKEDSGKLSTYN